jgi:hypothetical protein
LVRPAAFFLLFGGAHDAAEEPAVEEDDFGSVVTLLQFTGANGSTAFTDQSIDDNTITALGDAQVQSNKLELDGTGDGLSLTPLRPKAARWIGDGTLEFFGVVFDSKTVANKTLASNHSPSDGERGWQFFYNITTGRLHLQIWPDGLSGANDTDAAFDPTLGTAYDICLERSGSTWRIYVDGTSLALTQTECGAEDTFATAQPVTYGTASSGAPFDGRIRAIRFTHGLARYAGNYTVPSFPLPTVKTGLTLATAVTDWETATDALRVQYGGATPGVLDTNLNGSTTGRTFVSANVADAIRQDGYIRRVTVGVDEVGAALGWRFLVMRPNAATYDVIATSATVTPAGTGPQTFSLATPLGPCQPGDYLGVWVRGSTGGARAALDAQATGSVKFIGSLATGGEVYSSVVATMSAICHGAPPFMICTGDSIIEGHNGASNWHSHYHNGPAGTAGAEPFNQVRALSTTLTYQNFGEGGTNWAETLTKAAAIATVNPASVYVHCGVNDVSDGRVWADVEDDMDDFYAGLSATCTMFVAEILPWTAGNDAQAASVRTFNANYATWIASHPRAVLVTCHDAMGQTRVSTGQLDDLLTAYNQDGVHLTVSAGVDAYATLANSALTSNGW